MGTYDTTQQPHKAYQQAPPGTHPARIYAVAEIGWQETEYMGEKKVKNILYVGVELVNTKMDDGRPFGLSKEYPISFHDGESTGKPAGLFTLVTSLFGAVPKAFNPESLVGLPALALVVSKTGKDGVKRSKLSSLTAVPEGMPVKAAVNESVYYDINNPKPDALAKLPKWVQAKIAQAIAEDTAYLSDIVYPDGGDIPF